MLADARIFCIYPLWRLEEVNDMIQIAYDFEDGDAVIAAALATDVRESQQNSARPCSYC